MWVRLRDEAKRKAGSNWDPKQFHRVLTMGAMPLAVLEKVARERIASVTGIIARAPCRRA